MGSGSMLRPLYGANALAGRTRRFREKAGSIAWNKKMSSEKIKNYMGARLTQLLGNDSHLDSIKSLPNLTKERENWPIFVWSAWDRDPKRQVDCHSRIEEVLDRFNQASSRHPNGNSDDRSHE